MFELLAAWRAGDESALDDILRASFRGDSDGEALARRLLDERNRRMATRVEAELAAGGVVFVVVGAAHLVGEASLTRLLEARGHRVERLLQ